MESREESQEGQKLVDRQQKLVDRQQGMSEEEANGRAVAEKQLGDLVADETDVCSAKSLETNICSAKRPKCKYPTGEQVGVRSNHSNLLSSKNYDNTGV